MNGSDISTNYIIVKAESSFDGDPCDFAIFDISPEIFQQLQHYVQSARSEALVSCPGYDAATFFYNTQGFFRIGHGCSRIQLNDIMQGNTWRFINITEEELQDLEIPEAELEYARIEVRPSGAFKFTAIGDGTDTGFRTQELLISELAPFYP